MKKSTPKPSDKFIDTGRLKASKKTTPKKPMTIPVFIVTADKVPVIRVTGDKEDAERYRKIYADNPCWGKVKIVKRAVEV